MAPDVRARILAAAGSALLLALAGCLPEEFRVPPSDPGQPPLAPPGVAPPAHEAVPPSTPDPDPGPAPAPEPSVPAEDLSVVWGIAGLRGFALGQHTAPNGVEYHQLFSLDLNFNCWLWPEHGTYLFSDARFWGQRAAPGVTNPSQGAFDFSKRELDFDLGAAWNYWGPWEARAFAYAFNNLNRGTSLTAPTGYADGVGVEDRFYLGEEYARLGTASFDVARASFVSVGYFPSKDLTDTEGEAFKPGPFARAYLAWGPPGAVWYLFADGEFIAKRTFTAKQLYVDAGVAARPIPWAPRLEFRVGTEDTYDLEWHDPSTGVYGAVRLVF
jgi:hypothetical protein